MVHTCKIPILIPIRIQKYILLSVVFSPSYHLSLGSVKTGPFFKHPRYVWEWVRSFANSRESRSVEKTKQQKFIKRPILLFCLSWRQRSTIRDNHLASSICHHQLWHRTPHRKAHMQLWRKPNYTTTKEDWRQAFWIIILCQMRSGEGKKREKQNHSH